MNSCYYQLNSWEVLAFACSRGKGRYFRATSLGRKLIKVLKLEGRLRPLAFHFYELMEDDGGSSFPLVYRQDLLSVVNEAEKAIQEKTVMSLEIKDANKGGLILEWQGIAGFLPASQLKPEHYPRVPDGDKDKIFEELRKLIGEKLSVSIISVIPKEGKLILSEKSTTEKEREKIAQAGFNRSLAEHTYSDRLKQMFKIADK